MSWPEWWQIWRCRQDGMPRSGPTISQEYFGFGSQQIAALAARLMVIRIHPELDQGCHRRAKQAPPF
jgi:hypothetical protein